MLSADQRTTKGVRHRSVFFPTVSRPKGQSNPLSLSRDFWAAAFFLLWEEGRLLRFPPLPVPLPPSLLAPAAGAAEQLGGPGLENSTAMKAARCVVGRRKLFPGCKVSPSLLDQHRRFGSREKPSTRGQIGQEREREKDLRCRYVSPPPLLSFTDRAGSEQRERMEAVASLGRQPGHDVFRRIFGGIPCRTPAAAS